MKMTTLNLYLLVIYNLDRSNEASVQIIPICSVKEENKQDSFIILVLTTKDLNLQASEL